MSEVRVRRRPDVLWRRSLDAVVLLPLRGDDVLTLAGTGPAVWELLAEWRTVENLVEVLATTFDAPGERVEADLAPLLGDLRASGVLEETAESGGRSSE